jgi:two-component sensor histidine kinase
MNTIDDLYQKGPVIALLRNHADLWRITSTSENAVKFGIPSHGEFDLITVIQEEDKDLITRKLGAAVMQKRDEVTMRYRLHHPAGVQWVEDQCCLTYNPDGSVESAGSLLWTSTLPLEWRLLGKGANAWNMVSSKIRHDMLNQLTAILGYLELSQDLITDPMLEDFFGKEQNAAERIREKLIFTREYQKIGQLEFEWTKLASLFTEAIGEAGCSRLPVQNTIQPNIKIFIDKTFKQAVIKILENIPNHATSVTEIQISFQKSETGGIIIIEDDGTGIPSDQKKRIFELGFGSGDGFGLFLAEQELAVFGIKISETGIPGKCTRFELSLPAEILKL